MATINSLEIIQELLRNDGVYPGDPQAYQISSYINQYGDKTYHLAMNEAATHNLYASPFVESIEVLWIRGYGLTLEGKRLVEEVESK